MWAKAFRKIEDGHNQLSDTDFVWFPFLFLKLKPNQVMDVRHRLKMTPFFALYFALGAAVRDWILGAGVSLASSAEAFAWGFAIFFIWFNLVTAPLWNRRARRLSGSNTT